MIRVRVGGGPSGTSCEESDCVCTYVFLFYWLSIECFGGFLHVLKVLVTIVYIVVNIFYMFYSYKNFIYRDFFFFIVIYIL